jgi:hypothetical protein
VTTLSSEISSLTYENKTLLSKVDNIESMMQTKVGNMESMLQTMMKQLLAGTANSNLSYQNRLQNQTTMDTLPDMQL